MWRVRQLAARLVLHSTPTWEGFNYLFNYLTLKHILELMLLVAVQYWRAGALHTNVQGSAFVLPCMTAPPVAPLSPQAPSFP